MLVVLGAWGGLIPFIGPYFGYAFGSHATWDYTANRLWLDILPGLAVVVGGLILMQSGHRASGTLGAWFAMAGGAWFAVGPAVSRLWEHGPGPIGVPLFGHVRQTFELIGYFYGLGALVMGLAAFALGRFVSRPALVAEPVAAEPYAPEPYATQPYATELVAADPAATQPYATEPVAGATRPYATEPAPTGPAGAREPAAADPAAAPQFAGERPVPRPITGGSTQTAAPDSTAPNRDHVSA